MVEYGMSHSVSDLQRLLRELGKIYDFMPLVAIDGIFEEKTLESVLLFQKECYPPVTGVVTKEVWDAMTDEVEKTEKKLSKPRVLRAFPEGRDSLEFGEEQAEIALFQTMFSLLSIKIPDIIPEPPTGVYTEILRKNVIWLQQISGLVDSGALDRETWDRLARLYEITITAE